MKGKNVAESGSRPRARSAATIGPWNEGSPLRERRKAESAVTSEKPQWIFAFAASSPGDR
jgi:hypothetical protein